MSNALDAFRAQRDAAEQVQARLTEVADLLHAIRREAAALARDEGLRTLLQDEQTWLRRAEDLVVQVRHLREAEARRFWPAMWRRWVVAALFALAAAFAFGAGYVWASRPYDAELASLRFRVEVLDSVAARILAMTPGERRQFDALMELTSSPKR